MEGFWDLACDEVFAEGGDGFASGEAEDLEDVVFLDMVAAEGDELVEHGLCIAHAALGAAGEGVGGGVGELDGFLGGDGEEMGGDELGGDAFEIEALAAAEDGGGDFLDVGGGEDELHVSRWFLEGFEEGVEGRVREHVNFVDDVEFVLSAGGGVADVFDDDLADFVDLGVGGGVELEDIEAGARSDFAADIALVAGGDGGALDAVEGFGEDARGGGFPCAARAHEDVSVGEALLLDGVLERGGDVLLADDVGKRLRPIFAGKNRVAHGGNLMKRGHWANKISQGLVGLGWRWMSGWVGPRSRFWRRTVRGGAGWVL